MTTHSVQSALELLDASPDRLAVFEIPHAAPLTACQGMLLAMGEVVEGLRERLDDIVATAYNRGDHPQWPDAMLFVVHQHEWSDGRCTHCHEQQATA
ncbi:MAG: hypothetical protein M3401_17900 [Actinomycetota bacterium]|nr:hypothetical protein [Actinomycetota bacterium]